MPRPIATGLLAALVCAAAAPAWGAPALKAAAAVMHPQGKVTVTGTGFGPGEAVDVYFDTTDELLEFTDGTGRFGPDTIRIPADAPPGSHWLTAVGRKNGDGVHTRLVVRTNWVSHGYDASGRRYNPFENVINTSNVGSLDVAWSFQTGAPIFSSPAYNGLIYVGSEDGNVYALTTAGKLKWKTATGDQVLSSPAISGNTVYVGSNDHNVYALNAQTGAVQWTAPTGYPVLSSPAVAGGVVYVGSNALLYALDAKTGTLVWEGGFVTPPINQSSPAVGDGMVFVGYGSDYVGGYNTASHGAAAWAENTGGPVNSSPAAMNAEVFVGSESGHLYGLDTRFRVSSPLWNVALPAAVDASPAIANGNIYVASNDGSLTAFQLNVSTPLWTGRAGSGYSSPAIANGVVYIGSGGGNLFAFDAAKGSRLWTTYLGAAIQSSPTVADGMMFVGADDGQLYAFALNGGDNAVYHRSAQAPSFATLHPDRRLKPVRH